VHKLAKVNKKHGIKYAQITKNQMHIDTKAQKMYARFKENKTVFSNTERKGEK